MTFDLGGETLAKGFLLAGDVGGVQSVEARLDGHALPADQLRAGRGARYAGGALAAGALASGDFPDVQGPALCVWLPARRREAGGQVPRSPETERRLRALGYIQ